MKHSLCLRPCDKCPGPCCGWEGEVGHRCALHTLGRDPDRTPSAPAAAQGVPVQERDPESLPEPFCPGPCSHVSCRTVRQSKAEPCRECNVCADFAPLLPEPGLRCCQRCGHVMCPNRAKVCQHGIYADLCLPQCNLDGA